MGQIALLQLMRSQCRRIISSSAAIDSGVVNPRSTIPAAVMAHRRWASKAAAASEQHDSHVTTVCDKDTPSQVIQIRRLAGWTKRVSFLTGLYLTCMPPLPLLEDTNLILRGSVVASVFAASLFVERFTQSIVFRIRWEPGADSFQVKIMSDMGSVYADRIRFDDIIDFWSKPPYFLFRTRNGKFYYIESTTGLNKAFLDNMLAAGVRWKVENWNDYSGFCWVELVG